MYVIYKHGKKVAQADESDQLMDLRDRPIEVKSDLELLNALAQSGLPNQPVLFAATLLGNPKSTATVASDPKLAYFYAKEVAGSRWERGEPAILGNAYFASIYAANVIKGRWPVAEPLIMQNPEAAYRYADDVLKSRWPEAEPTIMQNPRVAANYAVFVIEKRWPEAEPIIMQDPASAAADFYRKILMRQQ